MDWLSGGENKPEPKPLTLRPPSGRELELVDAQEVEVRPPPDDTQTGGSVARGLVDHLSGGLRGHNQLSRNPPTLQTKLGEDDDIYEEDDQQDEMLTGEGSGTMVSGTKTTNVLYKIEPNKFAFQQSKIYLFVKDDIHWSFTCFLAWLFFLSFGVQPLNDYGYADWRGEDPDSETNWNGDQGPKMNSCRDAVDTSENRWQIFTCDPDAENIVSGPSGSGVVVISGILAAVGSVIFITRFLQYDAADKHPELTVLGYKYAVQKIYEACAKVR
mmetsp:Transcript_71869/g.203572  ORF Transcript_71869/g.203572 Transcript_71869/m.203572 type:complete len:271 (-) Transcript_71869:584-1396(-)